MKVTFELDPLYSDIQALTSHISRVLWCSIKRSHLTDQYFNNNILLVAGIIQEEDPQTYAEFSKIVKNTGKLQGYGKVKNKTAGYYVLDPKFWKPVWKCIIGEEPFVAEYKGEQVKWDEADACGLRFTPEQVMLLCGGEFPKEPGTDTQFGWDLVGSFIYEYGAFHPCSGEEVLPGPSILFEFKGTIL